MLPLLALLLVLAALAIFLGMYLNKDHGDNQADDNQKVAQQDKKDKASNNDKSNKEKSDSKDKKDDNSSNNASNDDNNSEANSDNASANNSNGVNNQANNQNAQQQQNGASQSNSAQGQQTHTVVGNQNLYRIAIQYYGNGSPENVNKIKAANGLTSNNISNGQHLVIPR